MTLAVTFSVIADNLLTSATPVVYVLTLPNLVSDGTGQAAVDAALAGITDDVLTAFAGTNPGN